METASKLSLDYIASMPWTDHIPVVTGSYSDLENLKAISQEVLSSMRKNGIDRTTQTIINKCWAYVTSHGPIDLRVDTIMKGLFFASEYWTIALDDSSEYKVSIEDMTKLCSFSVYFHRLLQGQIQTDGNKLKIYDLNREKLDYLLNEARNHGRSIPFSITTQDIIDWSRAIDKQDEHETTPQLPIPPLLDTALLFARFQCTKSILSLKIILYPAIEGLKDLALDEKFRIAIHLHDFFSISGLDMKEGSATLKLLGGFFGEYLCCNEHTLEIRAEIIELLNERKVRVLDIPQFLPGLEKLTSMTRLYIGGNPNITDQLMEQLQLLTDRTEIPDLSNPTFIDSYLQIFRLLEAKGDSFFKTCRGDDIRFILSDNFGRFVFYQKTAETRKGAIEVLMECGITEISIRKLFPEISHFTSLQKLVVFGDHHIFEDGDSNHDTHDEDLLFLKDLPCLSDLSLGNCRNLNGSGFVNLPPTLKKIQLEWCHKIPNEAFANLPEGITHLTLLDCLEPLLDNGVGEYLKKYESLSELKFIGVKSVDQDIQRYFMKHFGLKVFFS